MNEQRRIDDLNAEYQQPIFSSKRHLVYAVLIVIGAAMIVYKFAS